MTKHAGRACGLTSVSSLRWWSMDKCRAGFSSSSEHESMLVGIVESCEYQYHERLNEDHQRMNGQNTRVVALVRHTSFTRNILIALYEANAHGSPLSLRQRIAPETASMNDLLFLGLMSYVETTSMSATDDLPLLRSADRVSPGSPRVIGMNVS